MFSARITKISVCLAVMLVATSCGGGVSREDFVAEADPICARVTSAIAELGQPPVESQEELAAFLQEFVSITNEGLDDLRDVEPPEEDQDAVDEWLDTVAQSTDEAEAALAATEAGDRDTALAALGEAERLNTEANDLAADLGMDDCGTP